MYGNRSATGPHLVEPIEQHQRRDSTGPRRTVAQRGRQRRVIRIVRGDRAGATSAVIGTSGVVSMSVCRRSRTWSWRRSTAGRALAALPRKSPRRFADDGAEAGAQPAPAAHARATIRSRNSVETRMPRRATADRLTHDQGPPRGRPEQVPLEPLERDGAKEARAA